MTAPVPYLLLPGSAREALEFYRGVFGGEVEMFTREQFGRTDPPLDAIAHGMLRGNVDLYIADADGASEDAEPSDADTVPSGADTVPAGADVIPAGAGASAEKQGAHMLALLGVAEPTTLRTWFAALADGGEVIEPLQRRPWGASDGQVRDRFGQLWLIGYEHGASEGAGADAHAGGTRD